MIIRHEQQSTSMPMSLQGEGPMARNAERVLQWAQYVGGHHGGTGETDGAVLVPLARQLWEDWEFLPLD